MLQVTHYAPIRKSDDHEWIDTSCVWGSIEVVQWYLKAQEPKLPPQYIKANPVIRIAQIQITEIGG